MQTSWINIGCVQMKKTNAYLVSTRSQNYIKIKQKHSL